MKIVIDTEKSNQKVVKALLSELQAQQKRGKIVFEVEQAEQSKPKKTK